MIQRRISNERDLELFTESRTYKEFLDFVLELNAAAKGHNVQFTDPISASVKTISEILDKVGDALKRHPAQPSKSRFGKPEYVDFYDDIQSNSPQWFAELTDHPEVAEYFSESFGNRLRIDYGSGHEVNLMCCLFCLVKLGKLQEPDYLNVVMGVFPQYLRVMRTVQQTYWLEPAGSHGVWGLDDYHFLPYLFGSGQLVDDKYTRPISIHDEDIVAMYENHNLYFWCISFINRVKTASLRWHSPMLDDISGVKKWAKVNEGMIKMYKAEVLGKLPIMQHFLFGDLLPAPEGVTAANDVGEEVHVQCWADCCGIRVPSAIAANASERQEPDQNGRRGGHILKRSAAVPVD